MVRAADWARDVASVRLSGRDAVVGREPAAVVGRENAAMRCPKYGDTFSTYQKTDPDSRREVIDMRIYES